MSAAALGVKDLGVLAAGKKGSFIVYSSNPLETITNTKDIESVYINGHLLDRLEMVRQIKVEKVTVSTEERSADEAIRRREAEEAADAGLKKYGKFPLGQSSTRDCRPHSTDSEAFEVLRFRRTTLQGHRDKLQGQRNGTPATSTPRC